LSGSYPAPTVARVNGAAVGTTTPLARGDLLVANATPALSRLALGASGTVLQSNGTDALWTTPPGGAPSGTASGDLSGTYPGPTVARINGAALGTTTPVTRGDILVGNATPQLARLAKGAAGTVLSATATDAVWQALAQSQFPTAPNGLLTANLNDSQVTTAKLAAGAAFYWLASGTANGNITISTTEILLIDVDATAATVNRPILVLGVCPVTYANSTATPMNASLVAYLKSGGAAGQVAGTVLTQINNLVAAPAFLSSGGLAVLPYLWTPTAAVGRLKLTVVQQTPSSPGAFQTNWSPMLAAVQWS